MAVLGRAVLSPAFFRLFTPPVFPGNEAKTQRARVLYVTLLSFFAYLSINQLTIWFGGKVPISNTWIGATLLGISIVCYIGLKKGYTRPVAVVLLLATYLLITVSIVHIGTIRAPLTAVYLALIIISGLLFDITGLFVSILLSSVIVGALIIAENGGFLPKPDYTVTLVQWMTSVTLYFSVGGLVTVVQRWTRSALGRAEAEIVERKRIEQELRLNHQQLEQANAELQKAISEVKTLSGLLPICSHCKKIRDDKGYWRMIEHYIAEHTDAEFSHGICPECRKELYPSLMKKET